VDDDRLKRRDLSDAEGARLEHLLPRHPRHGRRWLPADGGAPCERRRPWEARASMVRVACRYQASHGTLMPG
jgi:hypothetical protein